MFSDTGLTFLFAFFVFWTLVILVGVVLEFFELGFRRGHVRSRLVELYQKFLDWLEHPPKKGKV